jgi:hypothetical protein
MPMILLSLLPFAALSQNDSIWYSPEENKLIAAGLLRGKQCENNIGQMRISYGECQDQLAVQSVEIVKKDSEITELKASIVEKDLKIDKLESKVRNRNKTILVLTLAELVTVLMGIL